MGLLSSLKSFVSDKKTPKYGVTVGEVSNFGKTFDGDLLVEVSKYFNKYGKAGYLYDISTVNLGMYTEDDLDNDLKKIVNREEDRFNELKYHLDQPGNDASLFDIGKAGSFYYYLDNVRKGSDIIRKVAFEKGNVCHSSDTSI